ncbi:crotonobetainyl-CoA hydratase [Dongia mobilis]|uniref:Crotonobetainyl-CoA hydratase n=1 Tax=Dongia mobilis TaxID=578943 RepID=A0A4R6WEX5_9PROT|nr:enoyl-CoA hydratase-related protein [Dongia mobilis]TDQ78435.1 crotonobetainyl-CoA hydratase [Dongia mobilis]
MSQEVSVEIEGRVMTVTLNRPPANALTTETSTVLYEAFKRFNDDEDLRVAILTAAPNPKNIFSAGWDLKAVARGESRDEELGFDLGPGGIGGLTEFFDLYKPVIAAVNGAAVGGGFEMALASDIIVASEDAYFSLPEMQRGFLPDGGAVQKLHHRVPYNVAIDLMLTGRRLGALEAKHWGLVRDVVPKEKLLEHARDVARNIAGGAPLVTRALKEYMRYNAMTSPEEAHKVTRKAWVGKSNLTNYERMLQSSDFNEGAVAFSEKRNANFKGS